MMYLAEVDGLQTEQLCDEVIKAFIASGNQQKKKWPTNTHAADTHLIVPTTEGTMPDSKVWGFD